MDRDELLRTTELLRAAAERAVSPAEHDAIRFAAFAVIFIDLMGLDEQLKKFIRLNDVEDD